MSYLRALFYAIQFMTRLPVPGRWVGDVTEALQGKAVVMYPLVGLLIGGLLYGLDAVLLLVFPTSADFLICAVLLLLWVMLSGGLHLDGLSDSADAWLGGFGDRDKSLRIMKDPHSGPAGVIAIVLILLMKWSALVSIVDDAWWLLFAPLLGRVAVVVLFLTTPYVRADGLGAAAATHLPRVGVWISIVASVILVTALQPQAAAIVLPLVFMVGWLMRRMMLQRLGGMTGDTAGALIEVIELVVLLGGAVFTTVS